MFFRFFIVLEDDIGLILTRVLKNSVLDSKSINCYRRPRIYGALGGDVK